jgi:hypothetical protein
MDVDFDDAKYKSLDGDDIANFQDIDNSVTEIDNCHDVTVDFGTVPSVLYFLLYYNHLLLGLLFQQINKATSKI